MHTLRPRLACAWHCPPYIESNTIACTTSKDVRHHRILKLTSRQLTSVKLGLYARIVRGMRARVACGDARVQLAARAVHPAELLAEKKRRDYFRDCIQISLYIYIYVYTSKEDASLIPKQMVFGQVRLNR